MPERESIFLVMESEHGMLLEQRPPSGIWGGLLCLPELPLGEDATRYAQQHYGVTAMEWQEQAALRHTFTHFHLTLRPLHARVKPAPMAMDGSLRWLKRSDYAAAALPTPIRTLLERSRGE